MPTSLMSRRHKKAGGLAPAKVQTGSRSSFCIWNDFKKEKVGSGVGETPCLAILAKIDDRGPLSDMLRPHGSHKLPRAFRFSLQWQNILLLAIEGVKLGIHIWISPSEPYGQRVTDLKLWFFRLQAGNLKTRIIQGGPARHGLMPFFRN